jgi:MoxR-like ATPase
MATQNKIRLLLSLNIFGLDHLDPVILAALADERPLLLIGKHGTAKSELLNRLATALKLEHRHYNASLIAFDDLLGFPVPNEEKTQMRYISTPNNLWRAESVFLDEISRCRPENQNKLFAIVHEKRVQGIALDKLRYRWSAMNPPMSLDSLEAENEIYEGSQALDPALADRFPYIIEIPDFCDMEPDDRRRIVMQGSAPVEQSASTLDLRKLVRQCKSNRKEAELASLEWLSAYVDALVPPLREAKLSISGRRAVNLAQTTISILAASTTLQCELDVENASFLALKWGITQRAQGQVVDESKLLGIHRMACQQASQCVSSSTHRLYTTQSPIQRLALALPMSEDEVSNLEYTQMLTDVWAGLHVPERYILARHLLPLVNQFPRLTANGYEMLAGPFKKLINFTEAQEHKISIHKSRACEWDKLLADIPDENYPQRHQIQNIFYTLFTVEDVPVDTDHLMTLDKVWYAWFQEAKQSA